MLALSNGHEKIIELLIDAGANLVKNMIDY